jgi:hypothetical protein
VGWLIFNIFIHYYNTCGKSQKNTSCKSLNMYLSIYLCGVNFKCLLSFCENSNSFYFNQLSIYAFIGFHSLNFPFYILIISTSCHPIWHSFDASSINIIYSIPSCSNQLAMEPFDGFSILLCMILYRLS